MIYIFPEHVLQTLSADCYYYFVVSYINTHYVFRFKFTCKHLFLPILFKNHFLVHGEIIFDNSNIGSALR